MMDRIPGFSTRMAVILSAFIALFLAAGCGRTEGTAVPESVPGTIAPTALPSPTAETPSPTPTIEITPTPTAVPLERPQYSLAADLDYPNHRVVVEQSLQVPHPASSPLSGIDLAVAANDWPGVFSIQDIESGTHSLTGYDLAGNRLTIRLDEAGWQPGEVLGLRIRYTLDLPRQNSLEGFGPSAFGYTQIQTNLVDWFPLVPPYQEGSGWVIHDPWYFGENLVYPAADFEVSLGMGMTALVVAASAEPRSTEDPLQYSLESARNFVFSVSPDYTVTRQELDGITVLGYHFPGYQVPGRAAFEATLEALALYQTLFGAYDQPSLTLVQADFNHGVEFEGFYFLSRGFYDTYDGTKQNYLVAIAVHETAHQWWYGQVANDQALEPWLDESLCTFSELAYYEQLHPESVAWWWGTRVDFYQPEGRIDRSIYDFKGYANPYLSYRDATYLQGARFHSRLKTTLGDEAYYGFLRNYVQQFRNQIATGEDFFQLLGEYIDLDSQGWIVEYFPDFQSQ